MKKLILALAFLAFSVQAEEWFEMPNKAGGKILLLSAKCKNGGNLVISTAPNSTNLNGCWWVFANMIHIVWTHDGSASSFEPLSFKYMNNDEKKNP